MCLSYSGLVHRWILKGFQALFHTFSLVLYSEWDVMNDLAYVLQFFSIIFDGLGGVIYNAIYIILPRHFLEPIFFQYEFQLARKSELMACEVYFRKRKQCLYESETELQVMYYVYSEFLR